MNRVDSDRTADHDQEVLTPPPPEVVVLVEGASDAIAVRLLLARAGAAAEVVPMDGITNIDRCLERFDMSDGWRRVCGLYDLPEERFVFRALHRRGVARRRTTLRHHGFFVCDADLEDELIRAVGPDRCAAALQDVGLAGAFDTFVHQPQWRDQPTSAQLHRFAGAGSGRKALLAEHFTNLVADADVPAPLADLVRHVGLLGGEQG